MKNLIIIILLINTQCVAQNTNNMKDNINVTFSSGQEKNIIDGIIPVILTIENNTDQEISILLYYPNPNDLSFDCQQVSVKKKERGWNFSQRSAPIKIPMGETYKITYFLGRYFNFLKVGEVKISYNLNLNVITQNSKSENILYEGSFPIQIGNGTNEELKKQISYYRINLKSKDRKIKIEAEEALFYLNSAHEN